MAGAAPERLRVLQVIARMNVGGPASQVLALAEGLDPDRFDVEVVTGEPGAGEADFLELRSSRSRPISLPGLGPELHPAADARALGALDRVVGRFRPDVIHTHTAKAGLLGRLVARRRRVPAVHTFHGHLLHGYFGPAGTRAVVAIERQLARHTHRLLTVGERVRDELLLAGVGRLEQYRVLPPGVPLLETVDRAGARRALDLGPEAHVVACVGRLTAIKRPDRVLEAVARLRRQGLEATVLLAGDGEERPHLERRARELRLDVRFLGWRADVATIYAAADVAVLASDNEGMPVALVEAALCSRPAVATDVGSVREVVADGVTGLVVRVSAEGLSHGLARLLLDDALRQRMGEAATSRARAHFSTRALVESTAGIYEGLSGPLVAGGAGTAYRRHVE